MIKPYATIIVDDHPIVTEGLQLLFSRSEDVKIVACFNSGESLMSYTGLDRVEIILLDVFLPDINGIDLCIKLKKLYPKLIILGMSSQSERSIVLQMMHNGANGYLLKSATIDEFNDCIRQSISGKTVFSSDVKTMMDKTKETGLKDIPRLTTREREILLLLIEGRSTQEISDTLFLSFLTIQTHRRNLLHKFKVKNVVELINFVKSNNLL